MKRDENNTEYMDLKADSMTQLNFKIQQARAKGWELHTEIEEGKTIFSRKPFFNVTMKRRVK